eukprot:scaffold19927_cov65-Phaeocystis_antarctica.AAC.5
MASITVAQRAPVQEAVRALIWDRHDDLALAVHRRAHYARYATAWTSCRSLAMEKDVAACTNGTVWARHADGWRARAPIVTIQHEKVVATLFAKALGLGCSALARLHSHTKLPISLCKQLKHTPARRTGNDTRLVSTGRGNIRQRVRRHTQLARDLVLACLTL